MTKEIIKYLLKRSHYIFAAKETNQRSVFLRFGNRKERIVIDEEVNLFIEAVQKALDGMKDDYSRSLMKQFTLEGRSDVYIFTHNKITKGSYYRIKQEFTNTLFHLCILAGLVTEEEILILPSSPEWK